MTLLEKAKTAPNIVVNEPATLGEEFIDLAVAYANKEIDKGQLAWALKRKRQDAHLATGAYLLRAIWEGKVMVMKC